MADRSMYAVRTTYGIREMVNMAARNVNSGGRPRSQTSGTSLASTARIVEAVMRIDDRETTSKVRDSRGTILETSGRARTRLAQFARPGQHVACYCKESFTGINVGLSRRLVLQVALLRLLSPRYDRHDQA